VNAYFIFFLFITAGLLVSVARERIYVLSLRPTNEHYQPGEEALNTSRS
jgi:hypothetical protein